MKKLTKIKSLVIIAISILTTISIALGYTVTMTVKGLDLVTTSEEGNEIELQGKDPGIKGWEVKRGNVTITNNKFTMPAEDVVIEAIIEYTVTFDKNGGIGTMSPQVFRYGEPETLNPNTFTKAGYKFYGWSTTPNGNVMYKDKEEYNPSKNITLYAVWRSGIYTITTISDEGTNLTGDYDMCSICGGRDHAPENCDIVTITINGEKARVVEGAKAGLPTIITKGKGAIITREQSNQRCSVCGGRNHKCEVVNIDHNR